MSSSQKGGAKEETNPVTRKIVIAVNMTFFRSNPEASKVINGPVSAMTRAKALSR
ncbi:hypothetical protein D3C72_1906020 [compost metagenome]